MYKNHGQRACMSIRSCWIVPNAYILTCYLPHRPHPFPHFGLMGFLGDPDDERPGEKLPLRVTSIVGSPHYMAPEVSIGSATVSQRMMQLLHTNFPCLVPPPCCAHVCVFFFLRGFCFCVRVGGSWRCAVLRACFFFVSSLLLPCDRVVKILPCIYVSLLVPFFFIISP